MNYILGQCNQLLSAMALYSWQCYCNYALIIFYTVMKTTTKKDVKINGTSFYYAVF